MSRSLCAIFLSTALFLIGCSSSSVPAPTPTPAPPPTASTTIKHVIIIMQENRSFDNLFNGFPDADTVTSGMSKSVVIPLQAVPFEQGTDLDHSHAGWYKDYDNGLMDGFSHAASYPIPNLPYAYVPQSETVPIWNACKGLHFGRPHVPVEYGTELCGASIYDRGAVGGGRDNPTTRHVWGCDSAAGTTVTLIGPNGTSLPGPYPCFDYQTMADLLDAKGITWHYYAAAQTGDTDGGGFIWSAFDAIKHIRFGADWPNNVSRRRQPC